LISGDPKRLVSALSALEAAIVIHSRKGPFGIRELDLLVHSAGATIVSFDADQVLLARSAYEKFGKGHHPAALNLGACCSYALARSSGEPLLQSALARARTERGTGRAVASAILISPWSASLTALSLGKTFATSVPEPRRWSPQQ